MTRNYFFEIRYFNEIFLTAKTNRKFKENCRSVASSGSDYLFDLLIVCLRSRVSWLTSLSLLTYWFIRIQTSELITHPSYYFLARPKCDPLNPHINSVNRGIPYIALPHWPINYYQFSKAENRCLKRAYCRYINTMAMRRCAVSLPMQSYIIYKSYIYYSYRLTYIDRSFTLLLLLTLKYFSSITAVKIGKKKVCSIIC